MRRLCAVALGVFVGLVPACSPVTFSVTLGEDDGRLLEKVVARDDAPGDARVVLIDVRGVIAEKVGESLLTKGTSPVDELVARLDKAERDSSVKAVILRINSPGGTVTASGIMYREVRRFAERSGKPVVASLGEVAASGGYYLALSADEIIAEPTSITASIGVIIPTVNINEGLNRIGIRPRAIVSGPNKAMGDPLDPPVESHFVLLQGLVDEFYSQFRSLVVERRPGIKAARIDELTDGRVVSGVAAAEAGLVDSVGGVRDAFETAKRRAGVKGASLVKYHARGATPRSAYSAAEPPAPLAEASTQVNLLQINGLSSPGAGLGPYPTAYYLWSPSLE